MTPGEAPALTSVGAFFYLTAARYPIALYGPVRLPPILPHDLALYAWLRDLPPISPTYSSRRSSCISGQRFSTA